MTQQNSRQVLRDEDLDPAYILRKDRYSKGELKSTKRPHKVSKGEFSDRRADNRGLTRPDDE